MHAGHTAYDSPGDPVAGVQGLLANGGVVRGSCYPVKVLTIPLLFFWMDTPVRSDKYRDLLRMFNTNVDGKYCLCIALTRIKGVGRRFAKVVCQVAGINPYIRAGEISDKQEEQLIQIISKPIENGIPAWFVNKRKELESGLDMHINSNQFDQQWRNELERLRRAKANRGLRHAAKLKVRGQRTKCTGRRQGVVGVARKK